MDKKGINKIEGEMKHYTSRQKEIKLVYSEVYEDRKTAMMIC